MTLRLTLSYHGSSTLEIGLVIDDNGHVTGWQTSGRSVGRFARDLTAEEGAGLRRGLDLARSAAADRTQEPQPDSTTSVHPPSGATEQLVVDDLPDATFASNADPPSGFEALFVLLREVREDLAAHPLAAIELVVSDATRRSRLRHVGSEPITVRGEAEIRFEALVYDENSLVVDSESHTVQTAGVDGAVSAGWELELIDRLTLATPPPGGFLSVQAGSLGVDSLGDGVLRPAHFSWLSE